MFGFPLKMLMVVFLLALVPQAHGFEMLTSYKSAKFGLGRDANPRAVVRVVRDPALRQPADPTCPAASSIVMAYANHAQVTVDPGATTLPCENWRATRSGFRYRDPDGTAAGVRDIRYGRGRLLIRAAGAALPPIVGPVVYVETSLTVGDEAYLVRFLDFRRNDADGVVTRRSSRAAQVGEAALWDTVRGAPERGDRAKTMLTKAIRRRPRDGRSHFYLGALLSYRASNRFNGVAPDGAAIADLEAAQAPLDRAVELLPHDSVLLGFQAFTTYLNGVFQDDPERAARGLDQFEAATTANAFFNKSIALLTVPATLPGSSEYYQTRLLPWLEELLLDAVANRNAYPDVFSSRLAPHGAAGAGLIFGDVALKGGRVDLALIWYELAKRFGTVSGYPYQATIEQRLAEAQALSAANEVVEPSDDRVTGVLGVSPCSLCHYENR